MAIDTTEKKLSLLSMRNPFRRGRVLPEPDGSLDQGDRQHLLGLYAGILSGEFEFESVIELGTLYAQAGGVSLLYGQSGSLTAISGESGAISPLYGQIDSDG